MSSNGSSVKRRLPSIYYHAYCDQNISGGQKQTYRHVDALLKHGYSAYIFHSVENYRLSWFENDTPVIGPREFGSRFDPEVDVFVIPETLVSQANTSGIQRVIFNKNLYYGFNALERLRQTTDDDPYLDPRVLAAFVVSEHNERHLSYCYPSLPVVNVRNGIDPRIFKPVSLSMKKLQIAIAAKDMLRTQAILSCLRTRLRIACHERLPEHWNGCRPEFRMLTGMTEREVSACLGESLMLLHSSALEGLPTTVLEAIFSGCFIVAPAAGPLREILHEQPYLDFDEPSQIADHIWQLLMRHPHHDNSDLACISRSRHRAMEYSRDAEAALVARTWSEIIGIPL